MRKFLVSCQRAIRPTATQNASLKPKARRHVSDRSLRRNPREVLVSTSRAGTYICRRCLSSTPRHLYPEDNPADHEKPLTLSRSQSPRTAYDLFPSTLAAGPPPSGPFEVDKPSLRREFLQLQAQAHPDRHSDPSIKARAEATSAALNNAYKTLTDPLQRARHILLTQQGIDLENDEASKEDDQELLMSVLEAREIIEEAEDEAQLHPLHQENERRIEETETTMSAVFASGDWDAAKREAIRLRYWMNIRDSIQAWEKGKPVVLMH